MKIKPLLLLSMLAIGCDDCSQHPDYQQRVHSKDMIINNSSLITVTRVAVIKDQLAYNGERGVYRIVDKETGKEFVGVSGVGIAEVGAHRGHRHTIQDER